VRAAALKHLHDKDTNVAFASFYALTETATAGPSDAALDSFLTSSDLNERLPAAGALVSRGQKEGIPVLITALGSTKAIAWFDPPMEGWQYARFVLTTFTNKDLGLAKARERPETRRTEPTWARWYAQRGNGLSWDPSKRKFS
jgi:hypothetical protein